MNGPALIPTAGECAAHEFQARAMIANLTATLLGGVGGACIAMPESQAEFTAKESQVEGAIQTAKLIMTKLGLISVQQPQQPTPAVNGNGGAAGAKKDNWRPPGA
jgi:hypothetical protein